MKSNFKVRVAAIQMTSTPDRSANLHQARRLFLEALSHQPYLVSFPESFSFLSGRGKELLNGAETLQDVTVETLQEWCAEYGVWIHAGGIFLKSKKRLMKEVNLQMHFYILSLKISIYFGFVHNRNYCIRFH